MYGSVICLMVSNVLHESHDTHIRDSDSPLGISMCAEMGRESDIILDSGLAKTELFTTPVGGLVGL